MRLNQLKNILFLLLTVSMVACQPSTPNSGNSESQASGENRLDTQLVLNNAILEQSNQLENTVWKIKADSIIYSEDKKTATLNNVVGNLLLDNKIILKISAKTGEIQDNGNIIRLKEQIIASDPRNGSTINSNSVEWRPQENLLLIKEKLNGVHPDLEVTAESGKYFTDTERLEIQGDVVATTNQPSLQLNSDRLVWDIPRQAITSPGAVELVHYSENQTVTDKLVSDRAQLNLAEKKAILTKNIELITSSPQLQVATDFLTWNYQKRSGNTDRPIQIVDRDRQISLTGNQGEINLNQQIAKLQDGVKGVNQQKASEIYARQLTWKIDTEEIEAMGDVIYQQVDPQARLTGEKAVGNLGDNNIVVTSDGKKQVTSVIDN